MLRSDLDIFIKDALPILGSPGTVTVADEVWAIATTYDPGDTVSHKGAIYTCILESTGNEPPNDSYWTPTTVTHLRGQVNMDSVDLAANYADGLLVGVALGIPVYRKASLAAGKYEYVDEGGNTLLTNV